MQSSNTSSSNKTEYHHASGMSATSGTTTTGSRFEPVIDQRLKEMGKGAERVVTNETVREQQARRPVEEHTEFIEKPTIQQPTQYVTQQHVMEQKEAPIKLKQQEIRHVQENTVVQEQPVIVKKQEVQVQKEAPIQVTKHTTQHQTLPAIEKKEVFIQPVEAAPMSDRTANKVVSEYNSRGSQPVESSSSSDRTTNKTINEYNSRDVNQPVEPVYSSDRSTSKTTNEYISKDEAHTTGETDKRGVVAHIKQAAHNVKEKVRGAFDTGTSHEETVTETKSA